MTEAVVINPAMFLDFQQKQDNIKSLLDAVEREYSKNIPPEPVQEKAVTNKTAQEPRLSVKYGRGESIFRKPYTPPPKIRNREGYIPDFKINPHKWTKYTLNDVTADQVSDISNTNTALDFIKTLEKRKMSFNMDLDNDVVDDSRHVFRKPNNMRLASSKITEKESKTSFIGNKLVMPEYVVGCEQQKKSKRLVNISKVHESNCKVTLNHLTELEDEH